MTLRSQPWLNPSSRFTRLETQVQRRRVADLAPIRLDLAQAFEQLGLDSRGVSPRPVRPRARPIAGRRALRARRKSSKNHAQLVSEACAARTISNSSIRRSRLCSSVTLMASEKFLLRDGARIDATDASIRAAAPHDRATAAARSDRKSIPHDHSRNASHRTAACAIPDCVCGSRRHPQFERQRSTPCGAAPRAWRRRSRNFRPPDATRGSR